MKLPPLKGLLIHIIYWTLVAILTVISTAIGMIYIIDRTSILTKYQYNYTITELLPRLLKSRSHYRGR